MLRPERRPAEISFEHGYLLVVSRMTRPFRHERSRFSKKWHSLTDRSGQDQMGVSA